MVLDGSEFRALIWIQTGIVELMTVTEHKSGLGMASERRDLPLQLTRKPNVIGIQ